MYDGVISAEDGAVVRSYELKFDPVEKGGYKEVADKYWNQELVDTFKELKPRSLISDYNLTLCGKEEKLSNDTGYLLKTLVQEMGAYEERTGEKCFFSIASGNFASYLEGKVADQGIYSTPGKEKITQPPAGIKALYDQFKVEVGKECGDTIYWQDNEVRPTVKAARPDGMDDETYYGKHMETVGQKAFNKAAEIADRLGIPKEYQSQHFDAFELLIPGCTKVNAMETMTEMYDMPPEKMVYMGDNMNDLGALQYSGTGVVISNDNHEDASVREKTQNLKKALDKAGTSYIQTKQTFGEGANEVIVALIEALRQ